jgi:hypothetical protein
MVYAAAAAEGVDLMNRRRSFSTFLKISSIANGQICSKYQCATKRSFENADKGIFG